MRIIAVLTPNKDWESEALAELSVAFSMHSLIETSDPAESAKIIEDLVADMLEVDLHRFQRTVKFVARHTVDGTVASVSVLDNHQLLLRLRNPLLRQLVANGHELLVDLLTRFGQGERPKLTLAHCEVRERGGGHHEGFLFAEWRGGTNSFFSYVYSNKKSYFVGITALFLVGLSLEVVLTLMRIDSPMGELGQRLGAPMLVSSSVLMLERLAQWLDQRTPFLRWSPIQRRDLDGPLHGSFQPKAD